MTGPHRRISFAYVVQIDMPGNPIKVGHSRRLRNRFKSFLSATPADMRLLGASPGGMARENELKAALAHTVIRSEWGKPNWAIQDLLDKWFAAGEWFVPAIDKIAVFETFGVADRLRAAGALHPRPDCINYHWAGDVMQRAAVSDPLLGLHWDGFVLAAERPLLAGLTAPMAAAA